MTDEPYVLVLTFVLFVLFVNSFLKSSDPPPTPERPASKRETTRLYFYHFFACVMKIRLFYF